jgi:hypothetical protein
MKIAVDGVTTNSGPLVSSIARGAGMIAGNAEDGDVGCCTGGRFAHDTAASAMQAIAI